MSEEKKESITMNRVNGNIGDFNRAVRKLTKKEILELIEYMHEYGGFAYKDAFRACRNALD